MRLKLLFFKKTLHFPAFLTAYRSAEHARGTWAKLNSMQAWSQSKDKMADAVQELSLSKIKEIGGVDIDNLTNLNASKQNLGSVCNLR